MTRAHRPDPLLRRTAVVLAVSLLWAAATLLWRHPLAFVLFAIGSGGLAAYGLASYVRSLLRPADSRPSTVEEPL